MTNNKFTTYTINGCRLFEAKQIIEETGITVTNASVITRMLARHCPEAQTVKEWRMAGADIPADVRDNKRLMTEQQAARYLEHVPRACCPELHDMLFEVYEYWDNTFGERRWDMNGIVYEYASEQRQAMVELYALPEFKAQLDGVQASKKGVVIGVPVAVERTYTCSSEVTYNTKYEIPAYDTITKTAHFYITTDRMTEFEGYVMCGTGKERMTSREFEELKEVAAIIEEALGCTSEFHVITTPDTQEVYKDGDTYFYYVDHLPITSPFDDCPF